MVAAVRSGQSLRAVARRFRVGVATVAHWVQRAHGQRLDRVDWSDRSRAPHKTQRTAAAVEDLVLKTRGDLAQGDLGAIGAEAIRQALLDQGVAGVPSLRTINRILARRGAPDRRAFPAAWKLDLKKRPRGRLVYLRRSSGLSEVTLLGRTWPLGQVWPNRLVRCEVDLDRDKIRFFTLRRKAPTSQPQILEVDDRLPNRGFQD
jgi:hypothetical protein